MCVCACVCRSHQIPVCLFWAVHLYLSRDQCVCRFLTQEGLRGPEQGWPEKGLNVFLVPPGSGIWMELWGLRFVSSLLQSGWVNAGTEVALGRL